MIYAPRMPDPVAALAATGYLNDRYARRVLRIRQHGELLALRVIRGEFGREYLMRSLETLDLFWRCPGRFGIIRGKYGLFTTDGTSGIGIPQSSTEWTNAGFNGVVAPTSLYLCQEASGNAADSIGAFTLTAGGTPLYLQSVTGWSTKGFGFNETLNQRFTSTSASLPDVSTTTCTWLAYVANTTTPSSTRGILSVGTTAVSARVTTTPKFSIVANTTVTEGTNAPTTVVGMVMKHDRTNNLDRLYTLVSVLAPTFLSTSTGKQVQIGAFAAGNSLNGKVIYAARWDGTSGNIADADVANMQSALLFTRTWAASMSVGVSETNNLSESITALVQVIVALSETDNLSESITAQMATSGSVSETDNLSESITAQMATSGSVSETNSLSESMTARLSATPALVDTITLIESLAASLGVYMTVAEAVMLAEAVRSITHKTGDLSGSLIPALTQLSGTLTPALAQLLGVLSSDNGLNGKLVKR